MKLITHYKYFYLGVIATTTVALALALGLFTFIYGKGYSYLSNNPNACANCHVMQDHVKAWQASSHHSVATCNDCHTPNHFIGKLAVKGIDGFFHSYAFTTGDYHDPIFIKGFNRDIARKNCIRCHESNWSASTNNTGHMFETNCERCHGAVGHRIIAK